MKLKRVEVVVRPIDKGAAPRVFTAYQDAGPYLKERLGNYCSYCERKIETYLAVEHIQPKKWHPNLQNSWKNFLLACVNCNSSKGKQNVNVSDFFWPDRDNTLRALEYVEGGLVRPRVGLNARDGKRALDTVALTGLDSFPGSPERLPSGSDLRWLRRREVWELANKDLNRLAQEDTDIVRDLIVDNAVARGMFSIWWTVFEGDADMRRRLRLGFAGTDGGSFDANESLVPRTGGLL